MIVNYLSTIVFVLMMIAGWLLFGSGFNPPGPSSPWLLAGGWTFLSIVLSRALKIAAQWERALVYQFGKYVRTSGTTVVRTIFSLPPSR